MMPLGTKPTVNFAIKRIFGSPQNSMALIGLLNAILDLERPIEAVEVLNPFNYQEFAESELIVLGIRLSRHGGARVECRNADGNRLLRKMVGAHVVIDPDRRPQRLV